MENGFTSLGVTSPILKALTELGYENPTEVQRQAIPHLLNKEDLIVVSKTGSGKTAVFGIPLLQLTDPNSRRPQGLILTPTRELAVQVNEDIRHLSRHVPHKTMAVYGQHNMGAEIKGLRQRVSIVTGTPGRVYDHIQQRNLITSDIKFLVLDEADRILDMGFVDQVEKIIHRLPKQRITLVCSATMPPEIRRLCQRHMKQPSTVEIESETKTVDTVQQIYYRVNHDEKRRQLDRILKFEQPASCMIFCNRRSGVDRLQRFLTDRGYASQALHGNIPQGQRMDTINRFRQGRCKILVATDVAARGIHIDELSLVINYDVPEDKDSYVHRIGRTARTGNQGRAITLVTSEDIMGLYAIEEHIGALIEEAELPPQAEINRRRPAPKPPSRQPQKAKPQPKPKEPPAPPKQEAAPSVTITVKKASLFQRILKRIFKK